MLAGLVATSVAPSTANAQNKPPFSTANMIVGFAPGGGTDTTTRVVAGKVAENTGLSTVVQNRPGAGSLVAHQYILSSGAKDGSAIILTSVGPMTVLPHLTKAGFDPKKDFIPITMAVNFPNVLVVPASLGINSFQEFIEYARKNPGKINFASSGIGAASHMAGELLNQRAGIDMTHVPYKGGSPALNDLLAGRVDAYFSVPSSAKPHIDAGKLKAIATSGTKRSAQFPDIPAIGEIYPGFNATNWYAFMAPAGTPPEMVQWWNAEIVKALQSPDVQERLGKIGLDISTSTPEELAQAINAEYDTWGQVIKDRGIKLTN